MTEPIEYIGMEPVLRRQIVSIDQRLMDSMLEIAGTLANNQHGEQVNWEPFASWLTMTAQAITRARKAKRETKLKAAELREFFDERSGMWDNAA